tara:strand:+ start:4109 stop:5989 length:1881 start_codon:yes stop_codon:yes gene_type:complete
MAKKPQHLKIKKHQPVQDSVQLPLVKQIIFWVIASLIPFLCIAAVEISLRISGYEKEKQSLFVEAPNSPDYLLANAKFIERYFPSFVPEIAPNAFLKEKKPNTFRVFVFGGSSAEGFPYNFYNSFSDQLEQQLLLNTQGLNIEIINLGMTAVNSFVIRDLSPRILALEPDAVIIYAGHNEYYGSFGAATTQFGFTDSIRLKHTILWLKNLRVYQVLEQLLSWESETNGMTGVPNQDDGIGEQRTMMAKVIQDSNIPVGGDVYNLGIRQFEVNINDALTTFKKQEIPIYLGTIASNLKDQKPLTDDSLAMSVFEEAQMLYKSGDFTRAFQEFERAKELDGIRFRAPSKINELLRTFSKSEGIELVETQEVLRQASNSGLEDSTLFIDHLHPNDRGHKLMAALFFDALRTHPTIERALQPNPIQPPQCISTFEKAYAEVSIGRLLVGYPFQKGISLEEELDAYEHIYQSYLQKSYIDSIAAVASKEQVFVPEALSKVVVLARQRGDTMAAVTHSYDLLKWQLRSINLIETTIEFTLNSGENKGYLINLLHQVLNDGNKDPRYVDLLSSLYLLNEQLDQAEFWLKETERLAPNSPRLLYNYSRFYLLSGDSLKARTYYQQFLETQSNRP